ncbi:MAG: substrate-binding domain-containing protein [Treponema sp.]|jgi:rhamnose transport system substrate-binding protein|nr:substrate-binding domain-containing protein [Treponema sp.]
MKQLKKLALIVLCLVMAMAFLTCKGSGGEQAASGGPLKIYFIPKDSVNPYFYAIDVGFKEAIAELGADKFEYIYTGPATAGPTDQIEYIEAAVQNKAFAVFVSANHDSALNRTFDDARAAGVNVFIMNQDIPGSEDHRDAAIMPASFANVGPLLIELMGQQMGYSGDFAILSATTDAPDQNAWIDGIKQALTDSKYANMNLVTVVYGDDQPEKSTTEMEALLTQYPNLKGVIAPTAAGIPACAKVLQTRRLSGQVKLTGLGLPSTMLEFVKDGTCESFALWNPPYEGYLATYLVDAIANKGYKPTPGSSFEAGKLGTVSVESNGQILTLKDLMVYDASNIDEYAPLF